LEFKGNVHRPAIFLELKNLKFNPRISNNHTEAVDFSPSCNNETWIKKTDEAKVLPKIAYAYTYFIGNNTNGNIENWIFYVVVRSNTEESKEMEPFYKSWTACVRLILLERIVKDLNMTIVLDKPYGKCNQLPGFGAEMFLGAVPIVIFIMKKRMPTSRT
jgi:hypothetical protein